MNHMPAQEHPQPPYCDANGMVLIAELKSSLEDLVAMAAAYAGYYKASHDLPDYHQNHKEMINRAQRLLGGRCLP